MGPSSLAFHILICGDCISIRAVESIKQVFLVIHQMKYGIVQENKKMISCRSR